MVTYIFKFSIIKPLCLGVLHAGDIYARIRGPFVLMTCFNIYNRTETAPLYAFTSFYSLPIHSCTFHTLYIIPDDAIDRQKLGF